MIVIITGIIVLFCLIGAVMAGLLIDSRKTAKWTVDDERLSTHKRPYSHVEQGPDSLYPLSTGRNKNEPNNEKGGLR
jgi:hypothetical protein